MPSAKSPRAKLPGAKPGGAPPKKAPATPLLEWIAAGIGGALILAVVAVLSWEIVTGDDRPPTFVAQSLGVTPVAGGFIVEIEVENRGDRPAAQVEVEGELSWGDAKETAGVTFDYVPGHSTRTGGLFFKSDPTKGELELTSKGFTDP